MRKGIAFETIAYITIALVGATLLLMLASSLFPTLFRGLFCTVYSGAGSILPYVGGAEPPTPEGCIQRAAPIESEVWAQTDKDEVLSELAARIYACYKNNYQYVEGEKFCYGIILKKMEDSISELEFTNTLQKNKMCDYIQNSKYEDANENLLSFEEKTGKKCGDKDMVVWDVASQDNFIGNGYYILIKYVNYTIVIK